MESENFEDAIRIAISIGGDSDTIASMTAAIAEAYYQSIPNEFIEKMNTYLPQSFIKIMKI
ncbi:MAG: ADP-ribosylglycohydrolase family protein [Saprospiraceae bacterium]